MNNWNYTLSIICLVYDNNQKCLDDFLEYTKRVNVRHEVIIVDNRDDKTIPLTYNSPEAILVCTHKNLGILDGRRFGFEHSTGDYIWFIDIDDEIHTINDIDYGDSDIISFPYISEFIQYGHDPSGVIENDEVCTLDTLENIKCFLWNKWFKKEVLFRAYKKIPSFFCVYSEDTLLVTIALEYAKSVDCKKNPSIYKHTVNDNSTTLKIIKNQKEVDTLFVGYAEVFELLKKTKIKVNPFEKKNILWYTKIADKADENVQPYFIKKLINIFGKEYVYGIVKSHYPHLLNYIPKEEVETNIKENLLSIVILFCDRDYLYLPELLKNIKEKVKLDYELVLIDNREGMNKVDVEGDYSLFQFGYNSTQIQGRKKGIELAQGEYIWFIDADDKICEEINSDYLDTKADIIAFDCKQNALYTENVLNYQNYCMISIALWNKWIKTEILKEVEKHIPYNLYGSASEDLMLVVGSLKYSKSLLCFQKKIYEYNKERSICCRPVIEKVENFKRIIRGLSEVNNCIAIMLSDNELYTLKLDSQYLNDCYFFMSRIVDCTDNILSECLDVFINNFTKKQIIKAWQLYCPSIKWTKSRYMKIRKFLFEKFPNDKKSFITMSTREYFKKDENGNFFCYKKEPFELLPPFVEENQK